MAWRPLFVLALPLAATGCTSDPISVVTDTQSDSSTTADSTTGETTVAATTTGEDSTSSGPGEESSSTAVVDDSTTGEPPSTSTGLGEIAVCGNNVIEGDEACDLTQVNGETCETLGYQGGELGCLLTCEDYNLLGCFICGNEVVDIAEDCEGEMLDEEITCESLGYQAGDVTCGADCLYDTSECSICGDGVQQGPEDCDGIDYGGETCASIGFDMGTLGCNLATCQFVYTGCSGGQYFQDFEGGPPLPLEFTTGGAMAWSVTNMGPINGTYSATSNDLGEGQNNFMHLDASFAIAGTISFMHDEDSEGSFDYLEFWMDGALQMEWSGQNAPAMYMQAVPAGMHSFEWRYTKDGIVSVGLDRVWVDDIMLTGGVPS
jgi:hypothetical protein